jgi:two-component system nitrogen regulation sensor histidine kinase NtrY
VSRLSYRGRLFLALLTVSVIPLSLMVVAVVLSLSPLTARQDPSNELERIEVTANRLNDALVGEGLDPAATLAKRDHEIAVTNLIRRFRQAGSISEDVKNGLPALIAIVALILLAVIAVIGVTLSRQLATPLHELVDWTARIARREPLPPAAFSDGGIAEFAVLRGALRDLSSSLEQAHAAELEAERLRAFGEVARRVAHEMKNPLTPIRLAVLQMRRSAVDELEEPLEVIAAESARLEAMAREFAELGRLPETISSPVDLRELLGEMLTAAVPEAMSKSFRCDQESVIIEAHYDPLRRAFSNILRNAVEACPPDGLVAITLEQDELGVRVTVADNGPGVPDEKRELIFQPYFTDKGDGTGLGLAIVRQTIEQHGGAITVADTPGGGATFLIRLPA